MREDEHPRIFEVGLIGSPFIFLFIAKARTSFALSKSVAYFYF